MRLAREGLGSGVRTVFSSTSRFQADLQSKHYPAVGVVFDRYIADPVHSKTFPRIRTEGSAYYELRIYVQAPNDPQEPGEGHAIMERLQQILIGKHLPGRRGANPAETTFPLLVVSESFEQHSGSELVFVASYSCRVAVTRE